MVFASKATLAERWDMTPRNVTNIVNEMLDDGRYGDFYYPSHRNTRIRVDAFDHYMMNRNDIKDGRKVIPYKKGMAT